MDQQDVIASIIPKRGRGPGRIVFKSGLEVSTFDPTLLRTTAENVGKEAKITWIEKPAKDPEKPPYKNLTALEVLAPPKDADITVCEVEEPKALVPVKSLPPIKSELEWVEEGFQLAIRQRELIEDFVKSRFKEGVHFYPGEMFGSKKPVLSQEGAQLIRTATGLRIVPKILAGPLDAPEETNAKYTILIEAQVFNRFGELVGSALGSASSLIWSHKAGSYRPRAADPDKTHNTTLKMAVKRAYVAAVRANTAAAEFFTEDLEDYGPNSTNGGETKGFIRKRR